MSLEQYRRERRLAAAQGETPAPDDTPAQGDPTRRHLRQAGFKRLRSDTPKEDLE